MLLDWITQEDGQFGFAVPLGCVALLILWHLIRFSLLPRLQAPQPKEIPYWIPFFGHVIPYTRNPTKALTDFRKLCKNEEEPYSIVVAGTKLYVITNPAQVAAVYRNSTNLTMEQFVRELMNGFDVTGWALDRSYECVPKGENNPQGKPLAEMSISYIRHQLFRNGLLEETAEHIMSMIDKWIRWDSLTSFTFVSKATDHFKEVSLKRFCEEVLFDAAVRGLYGNRLIDENPRLVDDFLEFERLSWKILYKYPKVFRKDAEMAKQKVIDVLQRYMDIPVEERPDTSYVVNADSGEMRRLGLKSKDIARYMTVLLWATNVNTYNLMFWMLTYLLHDKELLARVTAELQSCFSEDGSLDMGLISVDARLPYTMALWNEALRVTTSASSARYVIADTQLGPYILRKGNGILLPYHQLHRNTSVFGPNADSFDVNRFVENPVLEKSLSFRPFGGGKTHCPGRFLAKLETTMFLAYLLKRFDIELTEGSKFPRLDVARPGLGIAPPIEGDDLLVRLTKKQGDIHEGRDLS